MFIFFFFKQKTAYGMRISDWSSDVCSSDLMALEVQAKAVPTDVPDELMATSDVRPVEETMATRFASLPIEGRFDAIRSMDGDDKMALLAGLVATMVDGTVFAGGSRSEEHTSELQSLMRSSYAAYCLKNKKNEDETKET